MTPRTTTIEPTAAPPQRRPEQVAAADWSVHSAKRWLTRAERDPAGRYRVLAPEPVGPLTTLLDRLHAAGPGDGTILLGFDFPLGVPLPYAQVAGLADLPFREALARFGRVPPWQSFYEVTATPSVVQPFYPPPTRVAGEVSRAAHRAALGLTNGADLLRRCDHATPTRPAAGCLFFTLGGQQVGRGMIVGWRDLLAPALDRLRLWPFDGDLAPLLAQPGVVVAEVYPGEAYAHLGLTRGLGRGRSKRRRVDRQAVAPALLAQESADVCISADLRACIEAGFRDEDDFDATVGVLSMLQVVTGRRPAPVPADPVVRAVEGWILGQPVLDLTDADRELRG